MLDLNKPVETKDGRNVRIVCKDSKVPDYPIIGLVSKPDGSEVINSFTIDGKYMRNSDSDNDLQNVVNTRWAVMP